MNRLLTRTFPAFVLAVGLTACATALLADRDVSYTLVAVARQDIREISIILVDDGPAAVVTYQIRDRTGEVRESNRLALIPLTTPQLAQLNGFINGTVLPTVNSQEGL